MVMPREFRLDYEAGAGYLRYRRLAHDEHVARTARITDDVVVDYDAAGDIIGIEMLTFDSATLSAARNFAVANGLAFPALRPELLTA